MRPSGEDRAAARSASLSAAHTHSTSAWSFTEDRPETRPPAPRRATSEPSSLTAKETGPRLEAMSTRPPLCWPGGPAPASRAPRSAFPGNHPRSPGPCSPLRAEADRRSGP